MMIIGFIASLAFSIFELYMLLSHKTKNYTYDFAWLLFGVLLTLYYLGMIIVK